jgi:hypothetical protein
MAQNLHHVFGAEPGRKEDSNQKDPANQTNQVTRLLAIEMSRRKFLKGTFTGTAFLAGASLLPSGCAKYEPPETALQVFDAKEYATMRAAADRLIGQSDPQDPTASDGGVAAQFDAQLAYAPEEVRGQVKQMLQLFEHGPQLFFFSFKRFTELEPEDQDRYITGWMESSLAFRKTVFWAMKKITCAVYYSTPSVWSSIDYDGPWIGRVQNAGRGWAERQLRNFD